jgi:hypothetical protein
MLLRVLAFALGVQLSGGAHAASEVLSLVVSGMVEHDEQCPADGACDDCPPGCPSCHCQNHLPSVPPELASALLRERLPSTPIAALEVEAQVPLGPELPAVFRPPRARSRTT